MKTTAFTKYHIAAGAKMAEFAGYNMPIEFTGINDEHMAVRNGAGVFDVSHMGEIWVKGPKALDLLQRITTLIGNCIDRVKMDHCGLEKIDVIQPTTTLK